MALLTSVMPVEDRMPVILHKQTMRDGSANPTHVIC
jgi:hypothetical protein